MKNTFLTKIRRIPYGLYKRFGNGGVGKYISISSGRRYSIILKNRFTPKSVKKILLSLAFLTVNLTLLYWFGFFRRKVVYRIYNEDILTLAKIGDVHCNFPQLTPFAPDIFPFLSKSVQIKCHYATNGIEPAFITNSKNQLIRLRKLDVDCCYRVVNRVNDQLNAEGKECIQIKKNITKFKKDVDFIELFCVSANGPDYKDLFSFVHKKPEIEARVKRYEKLILNPNEVVENRISAVILGFDSTSHMHFLRQMPETIKYLKEGPLKDQVIALNGYTKVGENTLPNVVPLLTGMNLDEFKTKCVTMDKNARFQDRAHEKPHLDKCTHFIWNQFANRGFRTNFAEDDLTFTIFNHAWPYAFDRSPTDYYLRPFVKQVYKNHLAAEGFCYGTRLSFQVLLDNIENMAQTFSKKSEKYFQFVWASKLIHDKPNNLNLGDEPLLSLLKTLVSTNALNRTILILTADHGSRIEAIRRSPQGQIEDRMPLTYFIVPKWFDTRYPQAMRNLRSNSARLATAYDVHETLHDLYDLAQIEDVAIAKRQKTVLKRDGFNIVQEEQDQVDKNKIEIPIKGTSLFLELYENRTCYSAHVPLQWCMCNDRESLSRYSPIVEDGAYFLVESLNALMEKETDCSPLELSEISDAVKWKVVGKALKPNPISDSGENRVVKVTESELTFESIESAKKVEALILQITFITEPGEGLFEATILKNPADEKWILTEKIARINPYDDQGTCVSNQDLRQYCYCEQNAGLLSFF